MPQIGFNKLATVDGVPLGGTTPEALQQWIAAQYINSPSNPIVSGGVVTGRGDLAYAVSAGVGVMKTGAGAYLLTWPAGVSKLVSTPSTTRTDCVVIDRTGQIDVLVESSFDESKYIVLDRRILGAGRTATSQSTSDKRRNYALPYGTNLGWFGTYIERREGGVPSPEIMRDISFWVPTDRRVDIHVQQAIFGSGGGFCRYEILLDQALLTVFEMDFTGGYVVRSYSHWDVPVSVGDHTLRVRRVSTVGSPLFFGKNPGEAPGFVGIRDAGVAQ